jgi:hypothetical protein
MSYFKQKKKKKKKLEALFPEVVSISNSHVPVGKCTSFEDASGI